MPTLAGRFHTEHFKSGHCDFHNRPLTRETGQYPGVQKVIDRLSAMKALLPERVVPPEKKEAAN
jgi:hypothetical protein